MSRGVHGTDTLKSNTFLFASAVDGMGLNSFHEFILTAKVGRANDYQFEGKN